MGKSSSAEIARKLYPPGASGSLKRDAPPPGSSSLLKKSKMPATISPLSRLHDVERKPSPSPHSTVHQYDEIAKEGEGKRKILC